MGDRVMPWLIGFVFVLAAAAGPRLPADTVLGLRPGMSKQAALRQLSKIGRSSSERPHRTAEGESGAERHESEEASREQHWVLSDRSYAQAVVNFDARQRVRWISLFARPGGRAVRFRDIGDLTQAERRGNYIYVWSVPARGQRRPYQVIARSVLPDTLQSLTLMALPAGSP
jgi:hypothetical protein